MAKRLHTSEKKLRVRSDEVNLKDKEELQEVKKVISEMREVLKSKEDLIALTAKQLGYDKRVICLKYDNNHIKVLINPMIVKKENLYMSREKQIGLKNCVEYIIPRYKNLYIIYQSEDVVNNSVMIKEPASGIIQQLIELLDGVFVSDYGLEVLEGFDELSSEELSQLVKMYYRYLIDKEGLILKSIESDEDTKMFDKSIDFLSNMSLGNITTMPLTEDEMNALKEAVSEEQVSEEDKDAEGV